MTDRWYLVSRNGASGETAVVAYVAGDAAFEAYLAAEAAEQDDIEVLLLRAGSDTALRAAYPHYFVGGSRRQRMHQIMIGLDEVPA